LVIGSTTRFEGVSPFSVTASPEVFVVGAGTPVAGRGGGVRAAVDHRRRRFLFLYGSYHEGRLCRLEDRRVDDLL